MRCSRRTATVRAPRAGSGLKTQVSTYATQPPPFQVATRETRGDLRRGDFRRCVTIRARRGPGALFVAMRGERTDGHAFIPAAALDARRRGAGSGTFPGERARRNSLASWWRTARAALAAGGVFLPSTRPAAQAGRRHGHQRQNDYHLPAQAHLRARRAAVRLDRHGALRDRR